MKNNPHKDRMLRSLRLSSSISLRSYASKMREQALSAGW